LAPRCDDAADARLQRDNPAELFSPSRLLAAGCGTTKENKDYPYYLVRDHLVVMGEGTQAVKRTPMYPQPGWPLSRRIDAQEG
jgi:hypothetical protein